MPVKKNRLINQKHNASSPQEKGGIETTKLILPMRTNSEVYGITATQLLKVLSRAVNILPHLKSYFQQITISDT